jgi:hypothetical protein
VNGLPWSLEVWHWCNKENNNEIIIFVCYTDSDTEAHNQSAVCVLYCSHVTTHHYAVRTRDAGYLSVPQIRTEHPFICYSAHDFNEVRAHTGDLSVGGVRNFIPTVVL